MTRIGGPELVSVQFRALPWFAYIRVIAALCHLRQVLGKQPVEHLRVDVGFLPGTVLEAGVFRVFSRPTVGLPGRDEITRLLHGDKMIVI